MNRTLCINKFYSTKIGSHEFIEVVGPRRPLCKPPRKPQPSFKRTSNKSAQPPKPSKPSEK